MSPDKGKSFSG